MQTTQKNEVINFDFRSHNVRTILINDKPFFFAIDICNFLCLSDTNKAIKPLNDNQKLKRLQFVSGQNRSIWLLSESGVYRLMMRSDKKEAQPFLDWIADDVLPTIRKTGTYALARMEQQLQLELSPVETVRVIPNELYEELMTIESKAKRMKLMKLYKAIAAKGQTL
jgi:prophage antirepressor-like protein